MPNPFAAQPTGQPAGQQPAQPGGNAHAAPSSGSSSANPFAAAPPKKKSDQQSALSSQPGEEVAQPAELPKGAVGLDSNGQPFFGDGIPGIIKKWAFNFHKDVKDVSDTDWNDLKARWAQSEQASKQAGFNINPAAVKTDEQKQVAGEQSRIIGEAISKGWQDITASAQGSALAFPLKAINATVPAIADAFSLPAKYLEQAIGAKEGFQEAANEVDSILPKLDANHFTQAVEEIPVLGAAYDFARIALSPSDDKWKYTQQKIEEGWNSGRILYSQVFDATLKEKYLQEYREGKDPTLIAEKLQNPMAELAGQLVFDPTNLVGAFFKTAKTAKELEMVHDSLTASNVLKTEKGAEALKLVQSAEDEVSAIKALDTLTEARIEANAAAMGKSKLLNVGYGINDLTTSSRLNAIVTKGKTLIGNMALVLRQNGMSNDAIAEAIVYGARSVSDNADEVKQGLAAISHLPNANMWLSDDYAETFTVIRNLLKDEKGALTGAQLPGLMKASNPAEFAESATKLLATAAKSQFPDVSELAKAAELAKKAASGAGEVTTQTLEMAQKYESLPNHVKYLNKISTAIDKVRNPINSFLSPLYFNLQGGVAVKNIVANNELILIDKGAGAWFKDGKYWSQEGVVNYLKDVFGDVPESAHGFKSLVSAHTDKPAFLFGKLMEKGEEGGAARVVAASVRDTFKTMIPKAFPNLAREVEAGVLTQKQADKLVGMLIKNGGNVEKMVGEFRDLYKVGAVEAWRNLDHVSQFEREALESLGYWDEIENLASKGANTTDEIEQVFANIQKSIDSRSELATKDVIGLSSDHPNAETWGDLMKAVEDGHLDPSQHQVFTAVMESAEQARLEYQTLLDDVALKAQNALSGEGKLQEAQHIGQEMNRVRDILRKSGPATAKETHTITQDAWRWSDAIKAEKNPNPETLRTFWTKAGLNGDAPLDLNKQTLLKELWKQRFEKVSAAWNSSFDAIVGESETILKQMGGVVDTTELDSMAARTRHVTQQAQALRGAVYDGKALRIRPTQDVAYVAKQYGVSSEEILNTINNKLPEGTQAFGKIEDVPTNQVMDVLEQVRNEKGLPEITGVEVPPPHALGSQPSLPRAWNESARGAKYTLDRIKNGILEQWGKTDDARAISPEIEQVLGKISSEVTPKMNEIKAVALRVAEQQREFTLLNYGKKTYGDVALSYVMPYHFFYTRSYKNWISRIATNPEILAGYGKYKSTLEDINKDLPDWYKQQMNINPLTGNEAVKGKSVLGIPLDHPLYINLESTFNPLYGLTGTDFQDPAKRTNWATATMDDMGKFGPTMWAPIQMAIAAKLYMDGETDAASRWGNRLIPETAQVKAVTSLFGHPIELDPAVNFFSGGKDPYERGRMGYAASQLIQEGKYTPEQIQEQFQQQAGPAWDESYQMAVQSRAASSISSYFLGVGFKPRSTNDVMVEDMMTNLNKLYAMSDTMSPDQYKSEWEKLRSSYPDGLVDTVLLAKKGGDKRDAAYAFSVLGRLPPGEMGDVFKSIGISQKDISRFYDSKGFADPNAKFTTTEKQRFMAAIVDLGAMLKIPDTATRSEWNDAREAYQEVYAHIKQSLGDDIWDKVSHYYDLKDDNKDAADQFKQQHPEITQALQMKGEAVAQIPTLSAYYGGIDNIEAYISGKVRQQLSDKYGADIYDIQTEYFNVPNQKAYLRAHPELKQFWADSALLNKQGDQMFIEFGSKLPQGRSAQFRPDFTPESGVQQTLYDQLQPQNAVPAWEDVAQGMPGWLQDEVQNYWQAGGGGKLSKRAEKELDFLARQNGFYDRKDLLRSAGLALNTLQPQVQTAGNVFAQP